MKYLKTYEGVVINLELLNLELLNTIRSDHRIYKVEELVEKGADINSENSEHETPLFAAIEKSRFKIIKYLIQNGTDIDHQNDDGWTPLMMAVDTSSFESIEILVKAGADWNLKNIDGDDFFELSIVELQEIFIEKFPEEYENYLIKKSAKKYNL